MKIRYATAEDKIRVIRSLQNKRITYNTTAQAKVDIDLQRLIVIEENGKLLGSCAIVPEVEYKYTAIKRLCIYSKKSRGKGVATKLVEYIESLNLGDIGATPWDTNPAMCHILEKCGFEYEYTFSEHYKFYRKKSK